MAAAPTLSADPSLDIVSADVATSATTLTVVIRVAALAPTPDQNAPAGRSWQFGFAVGEDTVSIGLADGPLGPQEVTPYGGKITLDPARGEVRYSVPISQLPPGKAIKAAKAPLTNFHLSSSEGVEAPAKPGPPFVAYAQADTAASMKAYTPATASCLVVGS